MHCRIQRCVSIKNFSTRSFQPYIAPFSVLVFGLLFLPVVILYKGDGTGGGSFSLEFEGGVASSLPFSAGAAVVQASIQANLIDPTGSLQSASVSLEEVSSTRRSYLVTFPGDLGDVATMVGYGDGGAVISSVTVTEETQGSVQVMKQFFALYW